jgi:PAS domain S-box-containing protein
LTPGRIFDASEGRVGSSILQIRSSRASAPARSSGPDPWHDQHFAYPTRATRRAQAACCSLQIWMDAASGAPALALAGDANSSSIADRVGSQKTPQAFSFPGTLSPTVVLDCLADGILVTDIGDESRGPEIVYANPAVCEITGYSADELVGQSPKMLQGPDTDPAVMRQLRRDLDSGLFFNGQTINYRKDGTPFTMEWSISTLAGESGHPEYFVAVQRDVTLPARRLLKAEHAARTDPLTGLPNRSHIDDVLDRGGWLNARAGAAVVVDTTSRRSMTLTVMSSATRSCARSQGASPLPCATENSWPVGGVRSSASCPTAAEGGKLDLTPRLPVHAPTP